MKNNAPIKLYQLAISHYCEKIRWALDYKGLEYQIINLLPGLHFSKTKQFSTNSNLPILTHGQQVIQGSSQIIDYLDLNFTDKPLTPAEHDTAKLAKEWERVADEDIGPHIRRILYHSLLEHPKIVIPFFTHQGPWYSAIFYKLAFTKLAKVMRKFMSIDDQHVKQSTQLLSFTVDKLCHQLEHQNSPFIVGDQFSRADLAFSALLAPLITPVQYDLPWPTQFPPEIELLMSSFQDRLQHVNYCYQHYR